MDSFSNSPGFVFEGTLTFSAVTANTTADQTVTLPSGSFPKQPNSTPSGGPIMHIELPNLQAGLTFCNAHVINSSGSNQFTIRFTNTTGGGLTPTGTIAKIVAF